MIDRMSTNLSTPSRKVPRLNRSSVFMSRSVFTWRDECASRANGIYLMFPWGLVQILLLLLRSKLQAVAISRRRRLRSVTKY